MSAIPLSLTFSPSGPLVAGHPFLRYHLNAFRRLLGRNPSAFETAVALDLWQVWFRMPINDEAARFSALSSATGSGKTISACILLAYLSEAEGLSCAYVAPTLGLLEEARSHLQMLIPGRFAAYSSIHRADASTRALGEYEEQGVIPGAQYTEEDFQRAQVVLCTHERWKSEILSGTDRSVRLRQGKQRALVVIDEEPSLDDVIVRQPEDVSALLTVLTDVELRGEARAYGFTSDHCAATTLQQIHQRMRDLKDNANGQLLATVGPLVTVEDLAVLEGITVNELREKLAGASSAQRVEALEFLWDTLRFLKVAAQGRVFLARGNLGAFYAYGMAVPPQPRHLILDGTADLNGWYAVGNSVTVTRAVEANYKNAELVAVIPPRELVGALRPTRALRDERGVRKYLDWFMPFLAENTLPGESVLVYCKKDLLSFGVHKSPEFDESGDADRRYLTHYRGRIVHWCNFGRGRGLNEWKQCTSYFRLGDFYLKRNVVIAKIGAQSASALDDPTLARLASGTVRDARLQIATESHLAVTNKQDAARICIRSLDDEGRCKPARLFMVDCELSLLQRYRSQMFPGSNEYRVINLKQPTKPATSGPRGAMDGGAGRLALLLQTTSEGHLGLADAAALAGLGVNNLARVLRTYVVKEALAARGWKVVTRREAGLRGKGRVFFRRAVEQAA